MNGSGHARSPPNGASKRASTRPDAGKDLNDAGLSTSNGTTDKLRWRLLDERGRQRWKYLKTDNEVKDWPQSTADKYNLGMDTNLPQLPPAKTPMESIHNGLSFFQHLQLPPGNWSCEYGGPMFLLPGFVVTWYITQTPIPTEYRIEMCNYLFSKQRSDGGWGLHIEADSSVFGTAMNYVSLRLLGTDVDDPRVAKARGRLHEFGGAVMGPHWAKFWLSVLGVCEWEAVNPLPPELWLLPDYVPIAPWRWWIHMRMPFIPMSYIYSKRWSFPVNPLTRSLRQELYTQEYSSINFAAHRNTISPRDNYHPKTTLLNTINWTFTNVWPWIQPKWLKQRAEAWVYEMIKHEDENSDYACLAPVNSPMNTVARYIKEGPDSYAFRRHIERLDDFLWVSKDGMLVNGTNGVQSWDTAWLILTMIETGVTDAWRPMLLRALEFLDDQQIKVEVSDRDKFYRQQRKGAWPFSTREQGYTVSDCTAEAAKAVMLLQEQPGFPKLVSDERIRYAIDVLLTMQNASGGFSSYEPTRGNPDILEKFNAAEVFGRIMVEYDYPECTTACLTALHAFQKRHPGYRSAEISTVIENALNYIRDSQHADGSWYGSWGICYSYAAMFTLKALGIAGETHANSERVRRACQYFTDKQNSDGGWGESYKSCEDNVWTPHPEGSQVVQTAWVLMALMEAKFPDREVIERALKLIMRRQQGNGEWLQEGIEGVFNKSCMISYPNYKFYFPIMALAMYANRYSNAALI